MAKNYHTIDAEQRQFSLNYKQSSPVLDAFTSLHQTAMRDGVVSLKHKEMIALGIAIGARCDGCIAAHVAAALKAGATRQELVETIDIAIFMGGGPSVVYGTQALAAVDEYLQV